jgi:hypothetical protein
LRTRAAQLRRRRWGKQRRIAEEFGQHVAGTGDFRDGFVVVAQPQRPPMGHGVITHAMSGLSHSARHFPSARCRDPLPDHEERRSDRSSGENIEHTWRVLQVWTVVQ